MNKTRSLKTYIGKKITVCFISTIPNQAKVYIIKKLNPLKNVKLIFPKETSEENLLTIVPKADILIGWRPSKQVLLNATNLKAFINPGTGVTHLIKLFRELNIIRPVLLINGHGHSYLVAQHTIALLLTLMNKIIPHHEWMCQGKWRTGDKDVSSIPLRFRKVGLLGYGAINQKVHRFLSGFEVEFFILRKHWEKQNVPLPTQAIKYDFSHLHEFLEIIDTLIIAVPLTSLSSRMIKRREIELLGSNGIIVNVSRGEIIEEESLFNALKKKIIQGAAIDVWYNYSPESDKEGKIYPFNFPFHTLDNIVCSPHRANSPFSDNFRWNEVIDNIKRAAEDRVDFINIVDLEEEY